MKRFITAMLFSLTVIVCQQQTLFAAAIDEALRNCVAVGADPDRVAILDNFCWGTVSYQSNVASVTADSEEGHRGIPIAGVDRLVPLAGTNSGLHSMSSPLFRSSTTAVVDPAFTGNFRGCVPMDTDSHSAGNPDVIDPGAGKWHDCPPYDPCDDPTLHDDGPLLPWHGR
jgi:hypothetical protein